MKITGDAVLSARYSHPTYLVSEEDRKVCWTFRVRDLDEMAPWDSKPLEEQRLHLASGAWTSWTTSQDPSWCELHAVVARNALRNYLGHFGKGNTP